MTPITLWPAGVEKKTRALLGFEHFQGRIPVMTDITGFGFDIGDLVDFLKLVGKLDLAGFVIDADGFDVFLAAMLMIIWLISSRALLIMA